MFDGLKDMGKLLKQAQEMKSKMKEIQAELKKITVTGESSDRKIKITLNGEMDCQSVELDADLLNMDKAKIENSLKQGINQAVNKAKELASSKLAAVSGGLNLPGM